jgi:hypothetical protein
MGSPALQRVPQDCGILIVAARVSVHQLFQPRLDHGLFLEILYIIIS